MEVRVLLVDAFTTEVGKGNRAGVVLEAQGLSAMQMQAVARYLNVSETAFLLPPPAAQAGNGIFPFEMGGSLGADAADMLVRFFTPAVEVPVCGHATIATHYALAKERHIAEANHAMETGAGRMPVLIGMDANGEPEITMTQGQPVIGRTLDVADRSAIAAALGISFSSIRTDIPAQYVSTGSQVIILPLTDCEVLHAMQPDFAALAALTPRLGCPMLYVFAETPEGSAFCIDGRMFCPAEGIDEDPVTGMANGPAGVYLAEHGLLPGQSRSTDDETITFMARQGYAMGKEGYVEVTVYRFGGTAVAVQIAGKAVMAGSQHLRVSEDGTVIPCT